jgi:hypothetical protein
MTGSPGREPLRGVASPAEGEGGQLVRWQISKLAPQTGQCTNRVSRWEYATVVRVVVRMPLESSFEAPTARAPRLGTAARPRSNGAPNRAGWAPPPDLGPPSRLTPQPEAPKLGPTSEPSFFVEGPRLQSLRAVHFR